MVENNMYIARIGHTILSVLRYKVGPGNHQKESPYFRNFWKSGNFVSPKMTSHLTSHNFQILFKLEVFSKS